MFSAVTSARVRLSLALTFAFGLALAAPSAAHADCFCDAYLKFLPQYVLSQQVSAIGTAALHPEGNTFGLAGDEAAAEKLQIELDNHIPKECKGYVKGFIRLAPRVSLAMRGTIEGADPAFTMSSSRPNGIMGAYDGMYGTFNNSCTRPSDDQIKSAAGGDQAGIDAVSAYTGCMKTNSPAAYNKFSTVLKGTPAEIQAALREKGFDVTISDTKILKAYHDVINAGSEAQMLALIRQKKDGLNSEEFLTLVQMAGQQMSRGYDMARLSGPRSKGIVTGDQLVMSMRTNAMFQIGGYNDVNRDNGDFEGVCRDIAVLQARMLDARGFPNTFIVAYKVAGGGHADVVTGDPEHPTRVNILNYDGRSAKTGLDGARALFQGTGSGISDLTTNYRIYKPSGEQIMSVPSEMGKFLSEAAGFDIRTLDPLARANGSMLALNVSPDPGGHFQARVFHGTDGNGASYTGAAMSGRWGDGSMFPGRVGVVFATQMRPGAAYGTTDNGNAIIAYGQAEQHIVTPQIKLSPTTTMVIDAHGTFVYGYAQMTNGPNSSGSENSTTNMDHRIGVETRINQTALGGRLQARYRVGVDTQIGNSDVRDQSASTTILVPMRVYAGAGATLRAGDVNLIADATVVADQLGVRARVEGGVATRYLAVTAYGAGRVTDGTALIQDQALRRVGVTAMFQPNQHIQIGLTGETPVEGDDPLKGARMMGTFGVSY